VVGAALVERATCEGGRARVEEEGRGGCAGREVDRGKVGSMCVLGPVVGGREGIEGRGLLILLRAGGRLVPRLESRGGGRRESGRAGLFDGTGGEETETTWLNSREYHNTSSSSSSCSSSDSSSSGPSRKKESRVNSKVSAELASEVERDGVDLVTANGCIEMGGGR